MYHLLFNILPAFVLLYNKLTQKARERIGKIKQR